MGIQFLPLALETFGGLFETTGKTENNSSLNR